MRLIAIDCETTGLYARCEPKEDGTPGTDQIIQYTMQIWQDGVRSEQLTQYLHPHIQVPAEVRKINGYDENKWAAIPSARFADQRDVLNWAILHDAIVLGSNPEFDLRFISGTCRALGVAAPKPSHRRVNLNSLGMPLMAMGLIKSASLENLAKFFGIDTTGNHDSAVDVRISLDVWEAFLNLNLKAIGL